MEKQTKFLSTSISIKTGCGNMFVHLIFADDDRKVLHSVKATLGKAGGCARSHLESKVAMINSLILNTDNKTAIKTLVEAGGHRCYEEITCHDALISLIVEELIKVKI